MEIQGQIQIQICVCPFYSASPVSVSGPGIWLHWALAPTASEPFCGCQAEPSGLLATFLFIDQKHSRPEVDTPSFRDAGSGVRLRVWCPVITSAGTMI